LAQLFTLQLLEMSVATVRIFTFTPHINPDSDVNTSPRENFISPCREPINQLSRNPINQSIRIAPHHLSLLFTIHTINTI
jgi:hypothetical protein